MGLKHVLFLTFSYKGGHYSRREDWLGFRIKCYSLMQFPRTSRESLNKITELSTP